MATKEQLTGIQQINDAVNSLDQQTQQNAMIASQTHDVALSTDTIAKLVVSNANAKEFIGKESVQAKNMESTSTNATQTKVTQHATPVKKVSVDIPKQSQPKIKPVVANTSDDEWASF
ncbi:MAG: hypothetical protein WBG69_07095, partial [Arcobacteraceae bacterium]